MLEVCTYRLPFKQPFRTAGDEFSHREGIVLIYKEGDIEAYGEIAPLPGFSDESIEQVIEVLKVNYDHLEESIGSGDGKQALSMLDQIHQFPSLSFGIDTLLHDLQAKRAGRPLGTFLFQHFPKTLKANATLSIQEPAQVVSRAKALVDQGYKTLKIKVGKNFNSEFKLLQDLRNQFPDIALRIDANQSWGKDEAIQNLKALDSLNIEYCEQPVHKDHFSDIAAVQEAVKIPLAADESLRNKKDAVELSELKAGRLFIIKPMLLGTLDTIFVTKRTADTHNIEVVVTTMLESAVGRAMTSILAAGLGNQKRAHGLATGSLLDKDISSDKWMDNPVVRFREKAGLGISLDKEGLKKLF
ncbi:o-succinylbenzoate synthase [Gracilimonas sp.]|uniref:o-succinylbenzoate synthase n=1 Tax=Gracilimonas sp. TaxID=1974203 RepID=UPI003BAB4817